MKDNMLMPVYNHEDNAPKPIPGFHINRTTYLQGDLNNEPGRRTNFSLTLVLSGETTQYIDFEKYIVKAPAMILLSPGQIHRHTGDSLCEIVNISFTEEFLKDDTAAAQSLVCWCCVFETPVLLLSEVQLRELLGFAKLMLKEAETQKPLRDMILRGLLNLLMASAARLPQRDIAAMQVDTVQNRIVRQFNELSDVHYKDKTQVAHYADMMYVTPGHLNDTIKAVLGKTAKQVIDEKRIVEAKRLLFWGEYSIKEIAWQLKFEDDGYFNRFFKKHTGHTPATFQKSIREKYN